MNKTLTGIILAVLTAFMGIFTWLINRVNTHDINIAIIQTKLDVIQTDIKEIKEIIKKKGK